MVFLFQGGGADCDPDREGYDKKGNLNPKCKVKEPDKNEVSPSGTTWIKEYFPLRVGMYGIKIKVLQQKLKIPDDSKFGPITKNAITTKGYPVPLPIDDYNSIIASGGAPGGQTISGAYAKYDNARVFNANMSLKRTVNKNFWIGTVTGLHPSYNDFYEIDGFEYIAKAAVYLK